MGVEAAARAALPAVPHLIRDRGHEHALLPQCTPSSPLFVSPVSWVTPSKRICRVVRICKGGR